MTANTVFLGCDVETTCSAMPPEGQIIQVGVALKNGDTFVSDINPGWFKFTEEARKVNGFTDERVRAAPPAAEVDERLSKWLKERGCTENCIVPVGLNCGSFDTPFLRYYLPKTMKLFSYRSVDLNAVMFTLAEVSGVLFKVIKSRAKDFAANPQPHDAGADAKEALMMWDYLKYQMLRLVRFGE
jgi:oligoribonuclease (3'-5' exoribonuclease)